MLQILWGSPLPPIRSGISDYAVELLAELAQICDVRVLCPPGWDPSDWKLDIPTVDPLTKPNPDEIPLWHIGNNPYHEWLLERALAEPAILVVHDLVLHHLVVEATLARGKVGLFQEMMRSAHSLAGEQLAAGREVGLASRRDPFLFPARRPVLARARAAVVHSQWAAAQLAKDDPTLPVGVVSLCVEDPGVVDRDVIRERLGVAPDTFLLVHLGFLTPDKGLESVFIALASALKCGVKVHLVIAGQDAGGADTLVGDFTARLGIEDHVTATGWLSDDEMTRLPAAADMGVVLRDPSAGETSAAVLRFLACGTPATVVGLHQYLEWPETAVARVTPGPSMAAELARVVTRAASLNSEAVFESRRLAREAYLTRHTPYDTARQLVACLEELTDSAG